MFSEISNWELISIVVMGMTLILIFTNLLANKKFSWLSFILLLLVLATYGLKYFSSTNFNKLFGNISFIEMAMQIASGLVFLISFFAFVKSTNFNSIKKLLYKEVMLLNKNLYAVVSRNNKILVYDKKIKELLNKEYDGDLFVNGSKVNHLTKENLVNFKDEVVNLKIVENENIITEIKLTKQEINVNKRFIGFALVDVSLKKNISEESNLKNDILVYMDLLNNPLAYLDTASLNYICSSNFAKLLNLQEKVLKLEDLKKLVYIEDLSIYETKLNGANLPNSYSYRLNTNKGPMWFEESTARINNKEYTLIKKIDSNNISGLKYGTHRDFIHLVTNKKDYNFGILMLNFTGLEKYLLDKPHEFIDALINKFFIKINEGFLKDQFFVYKIGSFEFAMVVEGTNNIDSLVREFGKNISPLLTQSIFVNGTKYELNTEVGIVYGTDFEDKTTKDMIKASFDIMAEVTNPNFKEKFSIYQPVKPIEFSLVELGINIDEDLSKYE